MSEPGPHSRLRLDPRFEQHLRIEPGSCPAGVVMHLVDDEGKLLQERKLTVEEAAEGEAQRAALADVDRFQREHGPGRYFLYGYDGDTGECIGTLVMEPDE